MTAILHTTLTAIPYLQTSVLQQNLDLILLSADGHRIKVNKLMLVCSSGLAKELLLDEDSCNAISLSFTSETIRAFAEFFHTGRLPVKVSAELAELFNEFRINLSQLVLISDQVGDDEDHWDVDEPEIKIEEDATIAANSTLDDDFLDDEDDEHDLKFEDELGDNAELETGQEEMKENILTDEEEEAETTVKKSYGKQPVKCSYCGIMTLSLRWHVNKHHPEEANAPKTCEICGEVFEGRLINRRYRGHMNKHTKFPCKICGRVLSHNFTLKAHMIAAHGTEADRPYKCSYCPKRFVKKPNLEAHENRHTKTKPYKCRACEKYFTDHTTRHVHEKTVHSMHGGENHPSVTDGVSCEKCGKIFKGHYCKKSLRIHMQRIHADEDNIPRQCSACGKEFPKARNMIAHQEKNHPELCPVTCPICSRKFLTQSRLDLHHKDVHERGLGPCVCSFCGKEFSQKNALRSHERLKHGTGKALPYTCNVCGRGFLDAWKMKNHVAHHEKKEEIKCSFCDKTFKYKTAAKTHERTSHKTKRKRVIEQQQHQAEAAAAAAAAALIM